MQNIFFNISIFSIFFKNIHLIFLLEISQSCFSVPTTFSHVTGINKQFELTRKIWRWKNWVTDENDFYFFDTLIAILFSSVIIFLNH